MNLFQKCCLEDEINLLVIVVDVNPIWWGQQAQRDPQVLAVMFVVTLTH